MPKKGLKSLSNPGLKVYSAIVLKGCRPEGKRGTGLDWILNKGKISYFSQLFNTT
jgi:hypothetical protein